jgi:hypothetical protein
MIKYYFIEAIHELTVANAVEAFIAQEGYVCVTGVYNTLPYSSKDIDTLVIDQFGNYIPATKSMGETTQEIRYFCIEGDLRRYGLEDIALSLQGTEVRDTAKEAIKFIQDASK